MVSKKSHNVINIISWISLAGVAFGTMALIVILSVFNGLDGVIKSLFSVVDPDFKIAAVYGKTFSTDSVDLQKIKRLEFVDAISLCVEENVLLKYGDKQLLATIKGVDSNYCYVSGIDKSMDEGEFVLKKKNQQFAVVGRGIAYNLSIGLNFLTPVLVYVPRKIDDFSLTNPDEAFAKKMIFPVGIFMLKQEYDSKYIITPIEFTRDLLDYPVHKISYLEIKIKPKTDFDDAKVQLQKICGLKYLIKNRFEQHELLYRIMKSEKWAIFFILTFILIIASFNIIASIAMLLIDKRKDITTLNNLGANEITLKRIFIIEGWLISLIGAVAGLIFGLIICWIQIKFSVVRFPSSGSFVVEAYPVAMQLTDFAEVFITVAVIGFLAAWLPVQLILKNNLDVK